ncbi:MAG: sodium:solute symporter [Thermoplasmata archaeon]|uniref:Sodium:solute symporter n=1 Tax=Candidatus Sysuiplasma superficiale TaxID=2823368 RepID=A0A8J7YN09_9ARCH|nr:sodium:solute symporter [Candidatus Sysuiplasma superficiale]MBX8643768.1 sodium:solute symporter [Candidatus Sysuiplasma superficiale]
METPTLLGLPGIISFLVLFVIFAILGFTAGRWRRGDLGMIGEWALAGRKLGVYLTWFLIGADLYTAYTFVAVPSGVFAKGALFFFAVPYVATTFAIAMITMPKLWTEAKKHGYITSSDFVRDKFKSPTLAILLALTGIIAELPYIALQIVGMRAVLTVMLSGIANISTVVEVSLVLSFIVLALFTFATGLRGATLTAVFKDVLIFLTVIVIIVVVPLSYGGFQHAFAAKKSFQTLAPVAGSAYWTLWLGSAFALFLYPHAVNGALSSSDEKKLRRSTALLPIYGIGLALLALFGVLVYAVAPAMKYLGTFSAASRGILVVPALIVYTMPSWFAGIALLGIFIGGLVPAAIMAIAQANLFVRNIVKEFAPHMTDKTEASLAKWMSAVFKFIALGFVFIVPATYAIQLQLLGGIIILQILPSVFIGLFSKRLNKHSLIAGWAVGMFVGIYLVEVANHFKSLQTSFFNSSYGLLYIGLISVAINILISLVGSAVAAGIGVKSPVPEKA